MRWKKLGLVFVPNGELGWARTHAHLPTVDATRSDAVRVYFAALDENRFGRVGYVDVDPADPTRVLAVAREPVLDVGEVGTFDDCGAVPSRVLELDGRKHLYYIGFQRAERAPYLLFSGLAIGDENGEHFSRHSRVPILDRIPSDPFIRAAPYVLRDGAVLRMWYVSGAGWREGRSGTHYRCNIRHATSDDGIVWTASRDPCLVCEGEDEYAVGRPCVIVEDGLYRMWYSRRSFSEHYTLGYAESEDGSTWRRMDSEAGIRRSDSGWDSEMICYPAIVDVAGQRFLFYNGNGRGRSGFGVAVLEG